MRKKILWYLVTVLLIMQSETCFATESAYPSSDFSTFNDIIQIETTQASSQQRYTLEMYRKIKIGMTYHQCAEILCSDGILSYESDSSAGHSETWRWVNGARSFIELIFVNNRVFNKFQTGLR